MFVQFFHEFKAWFAENHALVGIITAYFICEVLAHTSKLKANSLFQLIFGWLRKEKDKFGDQLVKQEVAN